MIDKVYITQTLDDFLADKQVGLLQPENGKPFHGFNDAELACLQEALEVKCNQLRGYIEIIDVEHRRSWSAWHRPPSSHELKASLLAELDEYNKLTIKAENERYERWKS